MKYKIKNAKYRKAIFPGTFDPFTKGHLDIAKRSSKVIDELIIAVMINPQKNPILSLEERKSAIKYSIERAGIENARVISYSGFLVDLLKEEKASFVIRGLRGCREQEEEFNMYKINKEIEESFEVLYLLANDDLKGVSSSLVRSFLSFKGWEEKMERFVPFYSFNIMLKNFEGLKDRFLEQGFREKLYKKIVEAYGNLERKKYNLAYLFYCLKEAEKKGKDVEKAVWFLKVFKKEEENFEFILENLGKKEGEKIINIIKKEGKEVEEKVEDYLKNIE